MLYRKKEFIRLVLVILTLSTIISCKKDDVEPKSGVNIEDIIVDPDADQNINLQQTIAFRYQLKENEAVFDKDYNVLASRGLNLSRADADAFANKFAKLVPYSFRK
jgi:hypothetical protein